MNTREIYNKKLQTFDKISTLRKLLDGANEERILLCKECSHELVLVVDQYVQRLTGRSFQYFCPACSSFMNLSSNEDIKNTHLKDALIIDLTQYVINDFNSFYEAVSQIIFDNYDYFFDRNVLTNDKVEAIITALTKMEQHTNKVYIKEKI